MKITVLGCGALGQLWLSALHSAGHDVQGWLRISQPFCQANVISLQGITTNLTLPTNDQQHLATSDLLLVTLKAWQIAGAVIPLLPKLASGCPILFLNNGMGAIRELPVTTQPILQGITTHAVRPDGNAILHVANGITHIGPYNSHASASSVLAEILHRALPEVGWHDNMQIILWKKMAVNCVINPLTALYNCRNGELLQYEQHIHLLCEEIASVMEAEGVHILADSISQYVHLVMTHTANNFSSMHQDIQHHRHTEIDYITGYLLQCARRHGIDVPENKHLYEMIKQKENTYDRISAGLSRSWE